MEEKVTFGHLRSPRPLEITLTLGRMKIMHLQGHPDCPYMASGVKQYVMDALQANLPQLRRPDGPAPAA